MVRDGRVLLGRRARGADRGRWEVPGGFVDLAEHPEAAAVREIREELGLDVALVGMVGIHVYEAEGRWILSPTYVAVAVDREQPVVADPAEVLEWGWFDPTELPAPFLDRHRGKITSLLEGWEPGDGRPGWKRAGDGSEAT